MKLQNKFILSLFALCLMPYALLAADTPSTGPAYIVRPSIFSTSVDWEATTGLRLRQYSAKFSRGKAVHGPGWEMYILDSFPCVGQAEFARVWVGPKAGVSNDFDSKMYITCLYPPKTMNFAWREARKRDDQGQTKGMISCPVKDSGTELSIELDQCKEVGDWKDF